MVPPPPLVILHLGLGAFHRAHQAAFLQRLIDGGDSRWVLHSGNIRAGNEAAVAALLAQNGVYTLETVSPRGERRYQRIDAIRRVLPWDSTLTAVRQVGADPQTRIVSFTVTEAGYYLDDADRLDLAAPDIAADLAAVRAGAAGYTIYGALAAIVRERVRAGAGGVTLLNCDNVRHGGARARAGLVQFAEAAGDSEVLAWMHANTRSPSAMVDRITPRSSPDVSIRVQHAAPARRGPGRRDGRELHPMGHRGRLRRRTPSLGVRGRGDGELGRAARGREDPAPERDAHGRAAAPHAGLRSGRDFPLFLPRRCCSLSPRPQARSSGRRSAVPRRPASPPAPRPSRRRGTCPTAPRCCGRRRFPASPCRARSSGATASSCRRPSAAIPTRASGTASTATSTRPRTSGRTSGG